MRKIEFIFACLLLTACQIVSAQGRDTVVTFRNKPRYAQIYTVADKEWIYPKTGALDFIKLVPTTFKYSLKSAIRKESVKPWIVMAVSTAGLLIADQKIADEVHHFSRTIGLSNERSYRDAVTLHLGGRQINVYQAPQNLNTAFYSLGEGMPYILLSGGLLTHGLIKKDFRAVSTASQIMQGLIAMGITTQFLKRISGRESPFVATAPRGIWRPFPNPVTFQNNVPSYDAFPSGHMGTMITTMVILTENYPEKRWIKPVAFTLISIVGFSMINNDVHWASDYPLAIGLGYTFGKATVKINRWLKNERRQ